MVSFVVKYLVAYSALVFYEWCHEKPIEWKVNIIDACVILFIASLLGAILDKFGIIL